jgi:hypothetical protein
MSLMRSLVLCTKFVLVKNFEIEENLKPKNLYKYTTGGALYKFVVILHSSFQKFPLTNDNVKTNTFYIQVHIGTIKQTDENRCDEIRHKFLQNRRGLISVCEVVPLPCHKSPDH